MWGTWCGPPSDRREIWDQNKGDGSGGRCNLTQEDERVGKMGKTLPFVLEYLNVAFGQGLGQRSSLSLWPGQPQRRGILAGSLAVGSFLLN